MPALALAASVLLCTVLVGGDAMEVGVQPLKLPPQHKPLNDRFIVKWRPTAGGGNTSGLAAHVHAAAGRTRVQMAGLRHDVHSRQSIVRLTGYLAKVKAADRAALVRAVAADPLVEYIVEDRLVYPSLVPNDPLYSAQWQYVGEVVGGVSPTGLTYGLNLPDAWARTTGAAIPVAVVDTGITSHPDLDAKVLPGYDMISPNSPGVFTTANDGDGRDANPADPGDWTSTKASSWHGTHVAGTIGAATNNAVGVAGTSWGAKVLPVRALGSGGGFASDVNDAVRWAAGLPVAGVPANPNPARVINLSLGSNGVCDKAYQDAIDAAVNAGAVVVVAAGNSNQDTAATSPCSCQRVICVAAHGPSGQRAVYSNYGAQVDITAPGGDSSLGSGTYAIGSTWNTGTKGPGSPTYVYMEGTSMATPHVSGLVALLLSVNPDLTAETAEAVLKRTARPFPAPNVAPRNCALTTCGAGLADGASAVAFAASMPGNDRCVAALPVACGQVVRGTVQYATALSADPQCGGTTPTSADVWYALLTTGPTAVRLSTNSTDTDFDTQLNVYGGSCSSLQCVVGNNNCAGCGVRSDLPFAATAGTWLIRVSGAASARGTFALRVTCAADGSPSPAASPSGSPSPSPSGSLSPSPSVSASPVPSARPSQSPSASAKSRLSATPSNSPSPSPSPIRSPNPSTSTSPNPSPSPSPSVIVSPSASPRPSPSLSASPSSSPKPSASPSPSPNPSPSPSVSVSLSPSPSASPSASPSSSPKPSASPSSSPSPVPSPSPSPSPSVSVGPRPSPCPSPSLSASPSPSSSAKPSAIASPSPIPSPSPSSSASPGTSAIPSARASTTPSPRPSPIASPTASPRESTSASASANSSPSPKASFSASPSPSVSPQRNPSANASPSPSPSSSTQRSLSTSASPSPSPSPSPAASPSPSPSPSPSMSVSPSPSPRPSSSASASASLSPSSSPKPSASSSPSPIPSQASAHASATPSPHPPIASPTASPRESMSASASANSSPSPKASFSASPSPSVSPQRNPSANASPSPSSSTRSPSASASVSPSPAASPSASPSAGASASQPRLSPSPSPKGSLSPSPSISVEPSPCASASASARPAPSGSAGASPSVKPNPSPSLSASATASASAGARPSPSPSPVISSPSPIRPACQAAPVTCNSSTTSTTIGQPTSGGSLACQGVAHTAPDRWFVLAGLPFACNISLSALGAADFGPHLSVYTGVCDALTCLAANTTAPGTLRSQLILRTTGPLLILVHGNQTATGSFTLAITCN